MIDGIRPGGSSIACYVVPRDGFRRILCRKKDGSIHISRMSVFQGKLLLFMFIAGTLPTTIDDSLHVSQALHHWWNASWGAEGGGARLRRASYPDLVFEVKRNGRRATTTTVPLYSAVFSTLSETFRCVFGVPERCRIWNDCTTT